MTTTDNGNPIKGELLRFLLTDDYGVGEAQCKRERVLQCANIPQHEYKRASQALDEMIRNTNVPVYSKGGGDRDVVQVIPSQMGKIRELCNNWHPDRTPGQSFDRTDLSDGPMEVEYEFSVPYDYKGDVWNLLEVKDLPFEHRHGAVVNGVAADRLVFVVSGTRQTIKDMIDEVTDVTCGAVEASTDISRPAMAVQ